MASVESLAQVAPLLRREDKLLETVPTVLVLKVLVLELVVALELLTEQVVVVVLVMPLFPCFQ